MREIVFSVEGNAVSKQSFRIGTHGGYQSSRVVKWQAKVREEAAKAMNGTRPARTAVRVALTFYLSTISRADVDNLSKGVLDGLKGVVIADDVLVVSLQAAKRLATKELLPAVVVEVYPEPGIKVGLPRRKNPAELQKTRAEKAKTKQKQLAKMDREIPRRKK
jgi:Holliday junction resolvase RusA-like endonuclease